MYGAILSLTSRSVQLMKRIRAEPEYTLIGGILRWERMSKVIRQELKAEVNVPEGDMPQFTAAVGCALLGLHLSVAAVQLIGGLASRTTHRRYEYQVQDQLLAVGVVTGYAHFCAVATLLRESPSSGVRVSEGFYSATLVVNTLLLW